METIADRIIKIVDATGGNKSEFARRICLSPAYISKIDKQRDIVPSDRTISDICREFSVSETWLRTGEEEMFISLTKDEELGAFVGSVMKGEYGDFRRRLVSVLSRLDENEWKLLEKMAVSLVEEMKNADPE